MRAHLTSPNSVFAKELKVATMSLSLLIVSLVKVSFCYKETYFVPARDIYIPPVVKSTCPWPVDSADLNVNYVGCTETYSDDTRYSMFNPIIDMQRTTKITYDQNTACYAEKAADFIVDNWNSYESFVEDETGYDIKVCLKEVFQGKLWASTIYCVNDDDDPDDSGCYGDCTCDGDWCGKAWPAQHWIKLCHNNFLDPLDIRNQRTRVACYAALMAHEYAHVCWRGETAANNIEIATFNWWRQNFEANGTYESCAVPVNGQICPVGQKGPFFDHNLKRDPINDKDGYDGDNNYIYLAVSQQSIYCLLGLVILLMVNIGCAVYTICNKCNKRDNTPLMDIKHEIQETIQ